MKNELIKVKYESDKTLVSARELHEFLEVTERFQQWFDKRVDKYGFIENEDFTSVKTFTVVNNGAERELQDYAITTDMAKELSMIQNTPKGKEARRYFIECEKKLKEVPSPPKLPATYKEALLELVAKIEENEKLEKENRQLSGEIERKEDVIIGLVTDIDLAEKRQRISQIVRHGTKRYSERYNLLYSEFNKKYHTDVKRRLDNAKARGEVKKSANVMAYICDVMNMTAELYELSCKLFENDVKELMEEMWDIAS